MRKRLTKKSSTAVVLSPPPLPKAVPVQVPDKSPIPSPEGSPLVQFDFNLDGFRDVIALSPEKKSNNNLGAVSSGSKLVTPAFSASLKSVNSISELKNLASSGIDSIKRHLERSHTEIMKDIEASECRLQKRFKVQTQLCQQLTEEAGKEFKKMLDKINEGREAMEASFTEFIEEVQASTSRVCKTSIPELSESVEKDIAALRSRYGISSTPTFA